MNISKNMCLIDRGMRTGLSIFLIYIGFVNTGLVANTALNILLGGFGVLNLLSAVCGWCPVYWLANFNTCRTHSVDS